MELLNQLKSQINQSVLSELETTDAALVCTESEVIFLNPDGIQRAPLLEIAKVNREASELLISSANGVLIRGVVTAEKEALAPFFTVVQSAGQRAHAKAQEATRVASLPVVVTAPVMLEPKTESFHQDVRQAVPSMSSVDFSMTTQKVTTENAGFWMRFLAAIIDGIIVSVISSIVSGLFGLNAAWAKINELSTQIAAGGSSVQLQQDAMFLVVPMLLTFVFSLLLNWLYFALLESSKQQATLGKLALGLKVTNLTGQPIGFGQATWRFFAKQLPGIAALLLLFVGVAPFASVLSTPASPAAQAAAGSFLLLILLSLLISIVPSVMAGFTAQKQALHDLLAKTLVIKPRF